MDPRRCLSCVTVHFRLFCVKLASKQPVHRRRSLGAPKNLFVPNLRNTVEFHLRFCGRTQTKPWIHRWVFQGLLLNTTQRHNTGTHTIKIWTKILKDIGSISALPSRSFITLKVRRISPSLTRSSPSSLRPCQKDLRLSEPHTGATIQTFSNHNLPSRAVLQLPDQWHR